MVWHSRPPFASGAPSMGPAAGEAAQHAAVELEIDDQPGLVLVRSKFLEVAIRKNGVTLQVRRRGRLTVERMPRAANRCLGVSWERQSPAGGNFTAWVHASCRARSGRKPRPAHIRALPAVHRRLCRRPHGARLLPIRFHEPGALPHRSPRRRLLLLLRPDSETDFRGRHEVRGEGDPWTASTERFGSWEGLRATLLRLVHGAMTGMLEPTSICRRTPRAPLSCMRRARQLMSLVPAVTPGTRASSSFRLQSRSFYDAYREERTIGATRCGIPCPSSFPTIPSARATPTSSCWATRC